MDRSASRSIENPRVWLKAHSFHDLSRRLEVDWVFMSSRGRGRSLRLFNLALSRRVLKFLVHLVASQRAATP